MQITSINPDNKRITVQVQNVEPTFNDLHPLTVAYTSPAIAHVGRIGIKDVPNGRYLFGFIQFITQYKFIIEYEKGHFKIKLGVPISDGGGDAPEIFRTAAHDTTVGLPWYQPPLKVTAADGGNWKKPFTQYRTEVNDAPQGKFTWFHEAEDNTLRELTREHRFEIWLVIWDKVTSNVVEHLGMSVWEHKASITFDFHKPAGERVRIKHCFNKPVGNPVEVAGLGPIPPAALLAPTANDAARVAPKYKDRPRILGHDANIQ